MPKERKKVLCMDAQRHAEYYGMQRTFDELYAKSKAGETIHRPDGTGIKPGQHHAGLQEYQDQHRQLHSRNR